jgi:hypothetical protein
MGEARMPLPVKVMRHDIMKRPFLVFLTEQTGS